MPPTVQPVNDVLKYLKIQQPACLLMILKYIIERLEDLVILQSDIDALCEWARINNLTVNVGKCCYISFFESGGERLNTRYSIGSENLKILIRNWGCGLKRS